MNFAEASFRPIGTSYDQTETGGPYFEVVVATWWIQFITETVVPNGYQGNERHCSNQYSREGVVGIQSIRMSADQAESAIRILFNWLSQTGSAERSAAAQYRRIGDSDVLLKVALGVISTAGGPRALAAFTGFTRRGGIVMKKMILLLGLIRGIS